VLYVLREAGFEANSAALMQMFQGTAHEKTLARQSGYVELGENFDVAAEFSGLMTAQ